MAETSRSRVTITLGRGGQVVKRAGTVVDSGFRDSQPALGSKRSVRDRLGSDVDGIQLNNKRQRGDSNRLSTNGSSLDDARLSKNDLRFKLMRKDVLKRVQSDGRRNGADLRETLSRPVRPPTTNLNMRQRVPEPTQYRHLVPEQKDASTFRRVPPTRTADALPQMDSLRNSYSPWTMDQLRQRSPDRVLRDSRNILQQRNGEDITKRPLIRTYDDARTLPYVSRDIVEPRRPLGAPSYMERPAVSAASMKPVVPPPAPPPPPSGSMQRSSYEVAEPLTVDGLLHSLGLDKYAIFFRAEEVDMTALRQMGDNDLKALGIPMGPRKKILLALLPRSKRPS